MYRIWLSGWPASWTTTTWEKLAEKWHVFMTDPWRLYIEQYGWSKNISEQNLRPKIDELCFNKRYNDAQSLPELNDGRHLFYDSTIIESIHYFEINPDIEIDSTMLDKINQCKYDLIFWLEPIGLFDATWRMQKDLSWALKEWEWLMKTYKKYWHELIPIEKFFDIDTYNCADKLGKELIANESIAKRIQIIEHHIAQYRKAV